MANWIRADIKRGKKRSTQVFAHRGKLIVEKLLGYLDESINDDWVTRIFSPRLTKSFLIVPTFANESIISSIISTEYFSFVVENHPSMIRETEARRREERIAGAGRGGWEKRRRSRRRRTWIPWFTYFLFSPSSFLFHKPTHTYESSNLHAYRQIYGGRSVERRKFRVLARGQASL